MDFWESFPLRPITLFLNGITTVVTASGTIIRLEHCEDHRHHDDPPVFYPPEALKVKVADEVKVEVKEPVKVDLKEPVKVEVKDEVKVEVKDPIKVEVKEPVKVDIKEPIKVDLKDDLEVKVKGEIREKETFIIFNLTSLSEIGGTTITGVLSGTYAINVDYIIAAGPLV
jgi:hypothetical protein